MPKKFLYFLAVAVLSSVAVFAADATAPTTTSTLTPSSPNGKNGWYVTPVQVQLSATDLASGVKEIDYQVDDNDWQKTTFADSLNLAPNPSFEDIDESNIPMIASWTATAQSSGTTYLRDTANYAPGFATTSAKITSLDTGWHGINNMTSFATATPFSNMSASVWMKTSGVVETAYFKVYIVSQVPNGPITYTYLTQSPSITATTDWTKLSTNFVVNNANAIGVYIDIGFTGVGTVWIDAATISQTNTSTSVTFTVGDDSAGHTVEYYSVDAAGNSETHSCTNPKKNCLSFKIDQTPPGNFHDSGAFRGLFGSDHELYVYATVDDDTSGISVFTDHYTYHTKKNDGFGRFSDILNCGSDWQPNASVILITPPFTPGAHSVYILTPKTDFCDDDWKVCKTVRFYEEDMAGNSSTKDFCLNGPWMQFAGGGTVRANAGIDMIAEAENDNSDGLIESGNDEISFFTSSKGWEVKDSPTPDSYDYAKYLATVNPSPTTITGNLRTASGVYLINSNYEITNSDTPNNFKTSTFNQIYFINGDLRISNDITIADASTVLFIVKGKVEISKSVNNVKVAVFSDGDFYTAYDITEGEATSTLNLDGVFSADTFVVQRTLQGTNNNDSPSESLTYEPKYGVQLASYMGTNTVKWISEN